MGHYAEIFRTEGQNWSWGWQCFTCRQEAVGLETLDDAEHDMRDHQRDAGDSPEDDE